MEDRNWCFGYRGGINFNDPNDPQIFESKTSNFEISASISDSLGNLLLYLGRHAITSNITNDIMDANHEIVQNGEDIETSGSSARGAIIIPNYDRTKYFVFHTSFTSCSFTAWCGSLQYTLVDMEQNGGQGSVVERNVPLLNESVEEGLSATKHANGKDWWLLVHEHRKDNDPDCTDRFFKFLIQDTIISGPFIQDVGSSHCTTGYPAGEPRFSHQGNYLSYVSFKQNLLDVYCFNRFTGELTSLVNISGLDFPYSSEFSPNERFLYVTTGFSGSNNIVSGLDQYDLSSGNVADSKINIWTENDFYRTFGQLQNAPDKKIYAAIGSPYGSTGPPSLQDTALSYISRINAPDSLGLSCDLRLYDFYLGDSTVCYVNAPNIPNYNLAPLSFYESDAGEDQEICLGDTSVNGVVIGSPPVPGVIYSWSPSSGLSNSSIAQPFVSISSTQIQARTYILTMTDSTVSSLCQTRVDTVLVEVKDCSVGISEMRADPIGVYPNPTREFIIVKAAIPLSEVWLTDVSGRRLLKLYESDNQWRADLRAFRTGIYLIEAITEDGGRKVRKVIKSE